MTDPLHPRLCLPFSVFLSAKYVPPNLRLFLINPSIPDTPVPPDPPSLSTQEVPVRSANGGHLVPAEVERCADRWRRAYKGRRGRRDEIKVQQWTEEVGESGEKRVGERGEDGLRKRKGVPRNDDAGQKSQSMPWDLQSRMG